MRVIGTESAGRADRQRERATTMIATRMRETIYLSHSLSPSLSLSLFLSLSLYRIRGTILTVQCKVIGMKYRLNLTKTRIGYT